MKNPKKLLAVALTAATALVSGRALVAHADPPYVGSTFGDVWSTVTASPYAARRTERVQVTDFFRVGHNVLRDAASRTINDSHDVLPRFDKLLHPNGICLRGTWNITEASPYTGYFEQGRRGLIVARASVALSDTTRGSYRGFGFAGKLFPTEDPAHLDPKKTANFFVVDDLGGTRLDRYLDAAMTNEPAISVRPSSIFIAPIVPFIVNALSSADRQPTYRPVDGIAELGMADPTRAKAPKWIMIRGGDVDRLNASDFRDELYVEDHGGSIELDVLVADPTEPTWKKLGFIELTESVESEGCDHRLHFGHPRAR